MNPTAIAHIAQNLVSKFGSDTVLPRFTEHHGDFTLDDAYAIAHRVRDLRLERGERVVGRKIGGTNPATYHLTGATGPAWGFMYDTTVRALPDGIDTFALGTFRQPRIEPEIVLHLSTAPQPGMSEAQVLGCIDRVAHGYEMVHSPYAVWRVSPPDSTAAFGFHQALLVGPWHDISANRADWGEWLKTFTVTMRSSSGEEQRGAGANALGSPILALRAIVDDIGRHPDWTPIGAGEIVTTGTLTDLMPAIAGETWTTTIEGVPLEGLRVTFT